MIQQHLLHGNVICKKAYSCFPLPSLFFQIHKDLSSTEVLKCLMPLFHQRIKPRSCRRPLIVGSLGKNGKKIDQWGGRQNRYEGLGLTTDRPQDAPGGPRQSLTGLGLRTD